MIATINQCVQNNRYAQHQLYVAYVNLVYSICLRYLGTEVNAEDCLSDIFIKVFENMPKLKFENEQMFVSWLKKVSVNHCLMQLRKHQPICFVEKPEMEIELSDDILDHMEAEYLLNLIQELPSGYRTVFCLFAIEGYGHKEIAEMLQISEGTSKSQLNKARANLQSKIKKNDNR